VLDFDPERTPEIILKHRAISEKSVLYWVKDHAINLVVEPDIWLIAVHAQTKTAWVHNAVLQTAADIDRELTLCSSIAGEGGFAAKPALGSKAAYAWPWPTTVKKVVEALPNTFVYIDASFKPDSQRLLGLLAGTQLYSSPFAAVRELVQNAFDAVREQIALELLGVDPGVRGEKRSALQSIHQITLSTAEKRDGLWITCSDDGVGMTREVIQHHLLVGGSRARTEIADLRRRCQAEGIEFYRSGEFGIGILSYFMIADRLQVETRAGWEAHSQHENSGWRFETEGLDGFGELRRIAKQSRGTVVSLRVRPDREADVRAGLKDFLARQIRKVPCSFSLQIDGVSNFAPGWMPVPDFGDFLFAATSRSNRSSTGWISKNAREESLREKRLANELKVDAVSKLRFHRSEIISLPHGRGQMRMTVPYFIHEGHVSPVFLARDGDNVLSHRANLRGFKLTTRPMVSWRGFATSPAYDRISSSDDDDTEGLEMDSRFFVLTEYVPDEVDAAVLIEVDFITDATVSVDRSELRILAKEEIDGFIRARRLRYLHDFLREFQDSPSLVYRQYWAAALAGLGGYKPSSFQWFFANETDSRSITVRPIRFPAVYYTARPSYSPLPVLPTSNDMRFADFLFDVEGPAGTLTPLLETHPSRALIAVGQYGTTPLMVFDQPLVPREGQPSTCDFPPGWESLLCVSASGLQTRTFFNRGNPIVKATREINWSDERIDSEKLRALVHSEISLETAARIVLDSGDEDDEFWNALRDTHLDLYSKIWKALAAIGIQQIITWRAEQFADLTMLIVSETGAEFRTYSPDDVFGPFPTPDANWILETEAFDPSM
jgi:hypothetical protein